MLAPMCILPRKSASYFSEINYRLPDKDNANMCVFQDLLTSALTQGTFVLHNLKTAVNIAVPG